MLARSRSKLLFAAALAAVVAFPFAAEAETGLHITASGHQVPVYGSFAVTHPDGSIGQSCQRLGPADIEERELNLLSRAVAFDAAPHVTVSAAQGLTFQIVYTDAEASGFNDPELGPARRAALEAALAAWSRVLTGSVPINVEAKLAATENESLLAAAGPAGFVEADGMLLPFSLVSQLRGVAVNGGGSDFTIEFNPAIEWDYALDGRNAEGAVSFVYTAIHEAAHGMGFMDTFLPETGELSSGLPTPFDRFINRGSGDSNPVLGHEADQIIADLLSDDLFFNGPQANAASLASIRPLPMIKLYSPTTYEEGSSISHVDQATYSQIETGLMTPSDFGPGFDQIDSLAAAIMRDLGYTGAEAAEH